MSSKILSLLLAGLILAPSLAFAQTASDRVAFGGPVHVGAGEVVNDAVSFGGEVVVDGLVQGDVVSFGGDVTVRGEGRVEEEVS